MPLDARRKLALFLSFVLLLAAAATLLPDGLLLGDPACHSCHVAQMPVDHLLFRPNYLGYDSLCSFAPWSSLALLLTGTAIFVTSYRVRLERWVGEYRAIGPAICGGLALATALPLGTPYQNLIGGSTLCPLFPLSTGVMLGLGSAAYAGFMICPLMIIWRCRCPSMEDAMDIRQSPHRSAYKLVKLLLLGRLSEEDLRVLYRCTLCNGCWLSSLNWQTRKMAVERGIVPSHLATIRGAIDECGNPYAAMPPGVRADRDGGTDTLLFLGCTARHRAPEIAEATGRLLTSRGLPYYCADDETCCGYILFNLGDLHSARKAVDANVQKFKAAGVRRIITVCPGCYTAFNTLYKGRDGFRPEVTLAVDLLKGARVDGKGAIVHDPCHAKGWRDLVRDIARGAGDDDTGGCCGAGGGLISWDGMVAASRARRIVAESGRKVITYCPLCYLNFKRAAPGSVSDLYVLAASQEAG